MAKVNAQQYADKWGRRTSAAVQDMLSGVERTTKDPGALAAAAKTLWAQRLADPTVQSSWATNVAKGGGANWKNAMKVKAAARVPQGIQLAQQTKIQRWTNLLSAVDAAVADANAHPRGDINANIARANAFALSMHARAPRRTGG